ncbi:MAG TPA: hypothetical protein VK395_09845 [Gemmataceae bacterium]|nr:hypothetical protein [Gemmataceae bacterium]
MQDSLMLMTTIGMEISIQNVVAMEQEHMVIRGRLAGTADMGRVFFVPYDQINYLGFQKEMKQSQIQALVGDGAGAAAAQAAEEAKDRAQVEPEVTESLSKPEAEPQPVEPLEEPAEAAASGPRLPIPAKAKLLERLRARSRTPPQPSSGT